ncbi:Transcription MADS-box protein [Rutstroemia sp. NJR-2017a WRK4]|nr:Transcription MADS-box protein [Rutstroemia sp. NJR-2017a WRK4]
MIDKPERKSERLNRRKVTLLNKAYEISKFCEVDVALILRIRKTGQYITFTSTDLESWPPTKDEIQLSYLLPINLLSKDIEAQVKKRSTCSSNTA